MSELLTLHLRATNLYGTIRYFPLCKISDAICKVRGKKTLLLEDINTLVKAGFKFNIYDKNGDVDQL